MLLFMKKQSKDFIKHTDIDKNVNFYNKHIDPHRQLMVKAARAKIVPTRNFSPSAN